MAEQLVADDAGDTGDPLEDVVLVSDIDLSLAPRPIDDVVVRKLGDEIVLYHEAQEIVFVLDPIGAIVWGWLDGEVTLRDIADDFVAELGAPVEQVQEDLIFLAQRLGVMGLLKGVSTPDKVAESEGTLHVGDEMGAFSLQDLDGVETDITSLRGRKVLLVNWSPTCGFCLRIAPELAELAPQLVDHDVELVLLTNGTPEENREVFVEHGLHVRTLLEPEDDFDDDDDASADEPEAGAAAEADHDHDHDHGVRASANGHGLADDDEDGFDEDDLLGGYLDPFPAMGTPVAYLLDEEGRVAAPIAIGASAVPDLARSLAGIVEEPDTLPSDAKFLSIADDGTCGPGSTKSAKKPRVWAATGAYTIGEFRVGIRPDSMRTDEILTHFLSAERLPTGTRVPDDYSIVVGDGGTSQRGLNLVLQGGTTVVRTRSPRRALLGLAGYLASHIPSDSTGLLRTTALGILWEGEVVILPEDVNGWLDEMQPRLARLGAPLIDRPYVTIDVARRQVIVDDPAETLPLDVGVLDELGEPAPRRSELPAVEPGRYPLRRWLVWESREDPPLSAGQLTVRALVSSLEAGKFDWCLEAVEELRREGIVAPFDFMLIDELLSWLPDVIAGRPHAEPDPDALKGDLRFEGSDEAEAQADGDASSASAEADANA